jgi:hypothetical protein
LVDNKTVCRIFYYLILCITIYVIIYSYPLTQLEKTKIIINFPENPYSTGNTDNVTVKGTISKKNLPEGYYLWIVLKPESIEQWYPQGGGPIRCQDNEWEANVYFNKSEKSNEIAAIVVDSADNIYLKGWIDKSNLKNKYPGIPLPANSRKKSNITIFINKSL